MISKTKAEAVALEMYRRGSKQAEIAAATGLPHPTIFALCLKEQQEKIKQEAMT